jgi:hypothetical protein
MATETAASGQGCTMSLWCRHVVSRPFHHPVTEQVLPDGVLVTRLGGTLVIECDGGNNHVGGRAAWCMGAEELWRNGRFVSLPEAAAQ